MDLLEKHLVNDSFLKIDNQASFNSPNSVIVIKQIVKKPATRSEFS